MQNVSDIFLIECFRPPFDINLMPTKVVKFEEQYLCDKDNFENKYFYYDKV